MLVKLLGGVILGMDTHLIHVEVEHRNGFPGFDIVGLPDTAVRESKERVTQSIRHSGFDFTFRRILCNLAPANIKKMGAFLDLPIALGILMSSGVIDKTEIQNTLIVGELGFDGNLRSIPGALSLALLAKQQGIANIILPKQNSSEVSLLEGIRIFPAETLTEVLAVLSGKIKPMQPQTMDFCEPSFTQDLQDVKGQTFAKRAMEIAAAGFHNFLMVGSPGVGKTMLAKRFITIMPPLSFDESLELTQIYSVAQHKVGQHSGLVTHRPFRSPHHTASDISIIGGGSIPRPGEITLAHRGVLFLDEFPEFKKSVFEALREPLEDRTITISRTERSQQFPAHFLLIAAMNPCPCGYALHPTKPCHCSSTQILRYYNKISGPITDRIDIHVQMSETQYGDIKLKEASSQTIRKRVMQAFHRQVERFGAYRFNSEMSSSEIEKFCQISEEGERLLKSSLEKLSLSMRSYTKILKISRTIADLQDSKNIELPHLLEALQYRKNDQSFKGA